jgi:predicted permease
LADSLHALFANRLQRYYAHLSHDGRRLSRSKETRLRHPLADAPELLGFSARLFVSNIVESKLSSGEFGVIVAHFALVFVAMFALTWWSASLIGAGRGLQRAMTSAVLFYNAGNYGIPAAQLAFGAPGTAIQAIVVMLQNFTNFTLGTTLHAGAKGGRKRDTLRSMFKLPLLHTWFLGVLWRAGGQPLPSPIEYSLNLFSDAIVPVALVTLGAQMASLKRPPFSRAIGVTLVLRLLIAPLLAFAFARALNMHGVLAQSLIVATSFPVAVNTALIAIEFDNEVEFSSAVVFYSTLASVFTVSGAILLVRLLH